MISDLQKSIEKHTANNPELATQFEIGSALFKKAFCEVMENEQHHRMTSNVLTGGDGLEFEHEELYVPLGLVERKKQTKRDRQEGQPEQGSELYHYEEAINPISHDTFFNDVLWEGKSKSKGKRIAIIGEPGAGKTTFLQKIAEWILEVTDDIPIWINLGALGQKTIREYLLEDWLRDASQSLDRAPASWKSVFDQYLQEGKVWLLLDGVDEMGVENPLHQLALQLGEGWMKNVQIVLTCRLNVWEANKNELYQYNFDIYRNLDFDRGQIAQFINNWFAPINPDRGHKLNAALDEAGKERILDMVKNPLRLSLLCRTWQLYEGELPDNKAELYRQFVEAHYDWNCQTISDEKRQILNQALGKLALKAIDNEDSRFRLRESFIRQEMEPDLFALALDLGWLNRVGVAIENPGEKVYAFYHPTFEEYFASLVIDDWDYFIPKNHNIKQRPIQGIKYRIFQKEWKEIIIYWLNQNNISSNDFLIFLLKFESGISFFNDRARLMAIELSAELPNFSGSNIIVEILQNELKDYKKYQKKYQKIYKQCHKYLKNDLKLDLLLKIFENRQDYSSLARLTIIELFAGLPDFSSSNIIIEILQSELKNYNSDENIYKQCHKYLKDGLKLGLLLKIFENRQDYADLVKWKILDLLVKIKIKDEYKINRLFNLIKYKESDLVQSKFIYLANSSISNYLEAQSILQTIINNNKNNENLLNNCLSVLEKLKVKNEDGQNIITLEELFDFLNSTKSAESCNFYLSLLKEKNVGKEENIEIIIDYLIKIILLKDEAIELIYPNDNYYDPIDDCVYTTDIIKDLCREIFLKISLENFSLIDKILINLKSLFNIKIDDHTKINLERHNISDIFIACSANSDFDPFNLFSLLAIAEKEKKKIFLWGIDLLKKYEQFEREFIWNLINKLYSVLRFSDNNETIFDPSNLTNPEKTNIINIISNIFNNFGDRWKNNDPSEFANIKSELYSELRSKIRLIEIWKALEPENIEVSKQAQQLSIFWEKVAQITYHPRDQFHDIVDGYEPFISELTRDELTRDPSLTLCLFESPQEIEKMKANLELEYEPTNSTEVFHLTDYLRVGDIKNNKRKAIIASHSLIRVKDFQLLVEIIKQLKPFFQSTEIHLLEPERIEYCSDVIWHCCQNMSYPEFYKAWYNETKIDHPENLKISPLGNTAIAQTLNQQILDLPSQLQPTDKTYPLVINAQSLEDETDNSSIAQEICNQIYVIAFPDEINIPEINNAPQLKRLILNIKKQLETKNLALIFHNGEPNETLIKFCKKLSDSIHIKWITEQSIKIGIPPQENLVNILQNWINQLD